MKKIEFIVEKEQDGMSAERFLRDVHGVSHKIITRAKRIENGITCNSVHIRTIDTVKSNDFIAVLMYEDDQKVNAICDVDVEVLYEDDEFIIFNKPRNMPVHPSKKYGVNTLANFFMQYYINDDEQYTFRAVNRLDKDTSGAVLVAKNAYAVSACSDIQKEYIAVVRGRVVQREGVIDMPIMRESPDCQKRIVSDKGKRAITIYKVLEQNQDYSIVSVRLLTGRTHQIRVHFSSIGHPLVGDELYGEQSNLIKGQALHCRKMKFINDITKKRCFSFGRCS